jgi:DNA-3-methyladenine glycosylase II
MVTPALGEIIDRVGAHRPIITPDPFAALVNSVTHQQVSMIAAAAVYRRVRALCPRGRLSAKALRAVDFDTLRATGLSRQKTQYILNLAEAFGTRQLSAARLRAMTDEEVIAATTAIKGIGRWTAEMLLIFCLERPDVWPIDDLGLRKAVRAFVGAADFLPTDEIQALAEPWRPYRSYATWYLWRSLEGEQMPGVQV